MPLDDEIQVQIKAEVGQFNAGMEEATKSVNDFSSQASSGISKIEGAQKSWVSHLAKGQERRELRMIAMELGGLGGAGTAAGREMGAFLSVIGGLSGPIGIAIGAAAGLITGVIALGEAHKKAAEESRKQAEADLKLADAFDKAAASGKRLTMAEYEMSLLVGKEQAMNRAQLVSELSKQDKVVSDLLGRLHDLNSEWEASNHLNVNVRDEMNKLGVEYDEAVAKQTRLNFALGGGEKALVAETKSAKALTKTFKDELGPAIEKMTEQVDKDIKKKAVEDMKEWQKATAGVQKTFSNFLVDAVQGTKSLNEAWKDFMTNFVKSIEQALAQEAVMALFKLLGTALGIGTGGLGLLAIPALAEGGIVDRPTLAMIGESGPEAVVPLDKGGVGGGSFSIGNMKLDMHFPNVRNGQDLSGPRFQETLTRQLANGLIGLSNRMGIKTPQVA